MINPHYKIRQAELETSLPTLHMDYFFLGKDKQEDDVMPHLVVRCDKTNRTWATSLPEKRTHPYNVTWLAGIIREAGWKKMCLFSDNENAMKALKLKASNFHRRGLAGGGSWNSVGCTALKHKCLKSTKVCRRLRSCWTCVWMRRFVRE